MLTGVSGLSGLSGLIGIAGDGIANPEARSYFLAAGITDPTQRLAYDTLVTDLKAYGIYSKIIALYPFLGGTAASHKWNAINPLDTDAAFRIVWNGGVTHDANGVQMNGTTGYGDTKINCSTHLTSNDAGLFFYERTGTASGYDLAASTGGTTDFYVLCNNLNAAGNRGQVAFGTTSRTNASSTTAKTGFWTGMGETTPTNRGYRNGRSLASASPARTAYPNLNLFLGAINNSGTAAGFSNHQYLLAGACKFLNATENYNFNLAVLKYQTTLGRHVLDPFQLVTSRSQGLGSTGGTTSAGINTTNATIIVVSLSYYAPGETGDVAVTDNFGNTYMMLTKNANAQVANRLYYCKNPIVGSGHTFTATGGPAFFAISVLALAGAVTIVDPFESQNGANSASSSTLATGSVTPSVAGSLVVAGLTFDNNAAGAVSIDNGLSAISTAYNAGVSMGTGIAWKIQTGAVNPTWNITNFSPIAASVAVFKQGY